MNIGDTAKLNTTPEDIPETILRLFVYGTLKRGYWNHQRFCAQARNIEPAVVWGRLYHLHAGFPALEVPEGLILARGTADPLADEHQQHRQGGQKQRRPQLISHHRAPSRASSCRPAAVTGIVPVFPKDDMVQGHRTLRNPCCVPPLA